VIDEERDRRDHGENHPRNAQPVRSQAARRPDTSRGGGAETQASRHDHLSGLPEDAVFQELLHDGLFTHGAVSD